MSPGDPQVTVVVAEAPVVNMKLPRLVDGVEVPTKNLATADGVILSTSEVEEPIVK